MSEIIYKVIRREDLKEHEKMLLDFYDPDRSRGYLRSLQNVDFIIYAAEGDKVVGGTKIITDFYHCAMILDLLVLEDHRGRGIGNKIMEKTLDTLLEYGIKNIGLVTDPSRQWLPEFYSRFGFSILEEGKYMRLEKGKYTSLKNNR